MATRLIQNNFTGGALSPVLFGRTDLAKYANGLEECLNAVPQVHGGVKSRPGMKYADSIPVPTVAGMRIIPFVFNSEQAYGLVFLHNKMRIVKDGGFVVYPTGHASAGQIVEITSPYSAAYVNELRYTQIADTMYITHDSYVRYKLQRSDHHLWTFTAVSETHIAPPDQPTITGSEAPGSGQRLYIYLVTSVSATGDESVVDFSGGTPSQLVEALVTYPWPAGTLITLEWTAVTGAVAYRVYKYAGSFYGLIGETSGLKFTDDNILPSTTERLLKPSSKFSGTGDRPLACGMFEQRMFYGGSDNQPQTVIASMTALLDSFATTEFIKDTDALEYTLFSEQSERIKHFVAMENLLVFTSESEKILDHGANSDALTPTSVKVRTRSRFGCSDVRPVVVGNEVLFVRKNGQKVMNFFYSLEADGYDSTDLTVLNPDLLGTRQISDWAWDEDNNILWVLAGGVLHTLTYDRKQQVWAWATHVTFGNVMAIAAVPTATGGNTIYMIVQRYTKSGTTLTANYGLEYFYEGDRTKPETSFCVDGGLEYSGAAATVISGLNHLAGMDVAVLADGGVVPNITVASNGTITLPYAATRVIAGLGFYSVVTPLRINVNAGVGTIQGMFKSVNKLVLRLINTRGITVAAPHDGRSVPIEIKARGNEAYGNPSALINGDTPLTLFGSWDRDGQITIRQDYPLPFHVVAVMSEVEFED